LRGFLPGARQVVWIKDPQTEDRIAVVLSYAPSRGLINGRQFVEFNALPSQQGLAVQAIADDLTVAIEGTDAVIARPKGLNISDAQFAQAATTWTPVVATSGDSAAFADLAAWSKPIAETRAEAVRKLMRLSSTSPGGMSVPRVSLARFYIAEGFGAEALGVLGNIAREDKTADANPQFRVMRAIANIEMTRYKDALTDLSMEALGNDPHAALWRGIAAAGARDWRLARSNLMGAMRVMNRYPAAWEGRARVALAQAALSLNEPASAMQALSGMPKVVLPTDVTAEAQMVQAALDLVSGKKDNAVALYDQLMKSPYRPVAAQATLEGTLLKASLKKIKPEEAIDALERLRFQWRGDDVELKTLTELGKLYVDNNRVRDGLNTMRLAVRHFSNTDEARTTATQMAKIFEDLFLGGKADDLQAVQALALFYDFRELTPVGGQGDEMIRKLSERLIAVDLLPQAAELLQHQVDQRLDGIPKAAVATRLALIYLLDRKAEKALDLIRSTKQTRLPDELIAQRNLIEARALTDLKMYDEALDLVSADVSPEADRLRADVLWDAQRWPDAAAKTEALLGTRYEEIAPLTDEERNDVMRASVAYSLAGDSASLTRLSTRFGPKMSQSLDAKAFTLVTQSTDVTADDYKNLVKRVAAVDTLDAFLKDFRARYGQGGQTNPSATN
jgi:tetratricopeptide (TPR) repeat protein